MQRITISMFDDHNNNNNSTNYQQGEGNSTSLTSPLTLQQYASPNQNLITPLTPNTELLNNVIESLRQVKIDGQQYLDTSNYTDNSNDVNIFGGVSSSAMNWNHLLSNNMYQQHQQVEHAHMIQTEESNNFHNGNTCNSSSSFSNNVNNIIKESNTSSDEASNLFSLFDAHRKILLFDNLIEGELIRMTDRSASMNLDNNALIDLSEDRMRNRNSQNQTSETSIQQISLDCDNACQSQISDIFNVSQALQNITSLSPSDQNQLSRLIWTALMNNSNNSLTDDSSKSSSFNSIENNSELGNSGAYRMFESFEDVQMQFSQHVEALTLHQMVDEDNSPTTKSKYSSQPVLNSNGRYSIDNLSNSMIMQNGNSSSVIPHYSDSVDITTFLNNQFSSLQNQSLESSQSSTIIRGNTGISPTSPQSHYSTPMQQLSDSMTESTQQQFIISPKGNLNRIFNNPQQATTPNSVFDVSINTQPKQSTLSSPRRISSCSSSMISSSHSHTSSTRSTPTTISEQTLIQSTPILTPSDTNPGQDECIQPPLLLPKTSTQTCCGVGNNINFSLPGDSESAAVVKQFGKNNQSKKYSNNNFSETTLPHTSCVVNNVVGQQHFITTTTTSTTENHSSHHSNPLEASSVLNIQKSLSLQQSLDSSNSPRVVVPSPTSGNFHNSNPPTLLCITSKPTESNLDIITQQTLNNISTDYTMSSHSPISSSNSNEQNGQNKQYQGVMPLEGNQSTWGVKVNRKYRQLRKSLKTCKHFEDNYFVLELNGQGNNPGNPSAGQQPPKPKKPKAKAQPHANHDDKKPSIPIPYKEQVNLMGEFSVAKSIDDEVLPLSVLNRSEESDLYLTTPNSTSSASSRSSSAKDMTKKKRKNTSQEPTRKNRKKDSEQEMSLGGLDSTYNHDILPSINMTLNLAPMQTIPSLDNSEIMNFNKVTPDIMSYQPNNNIHHHQQQIPSLISPHKPLDYQPITPNLINYENTTSSSPHIINFENQASSTNQINNQAENRNLFSSGFPSNSSFGLFSTNEDFTTMKLPSNSSIDSFFKADLTDEKATNMPRNMSSSSDFLPLEETIVHHLPITNSNMNNHHPIHPITATQTQIVPPKIDIKPPKKEVEKNHLTRCMSHASLSMLDEEEEEEPVPVVNNNISNIPSIAISTKEIHHLAQEPTMEDIKSKSPLITPLNAVLYKNISVSNMDLVKLDVPSACVLRPIPSESMIEKDHAHWINEIKTLPSNDSLANMAIVDFDILSETKKH
ncbi:hypothetical protein NAEGRDRAFT_81041 [Naegleria gruberi]|uniref:Uncharacterized protein n=1 Tax=Naegleria gruberi TaxID=5762 RepID=D2VS78_NAEGR|nr:uncharacterized protein NAEGRDRAFT_81041 [Naegleria gruberi]EFC40294.1 hypothetical protein NAEGRDRAFT_81041 [Naegleria gruberi]|eukprot:XP_002673038.1 hypothetical protein NAEGRDRAFT_81041 [Naegleria gruberi strain NEG-M]